MIEPSVIAQLRRALQNDQLREQLCVSEADWQVFESDGPSELVRAVIHQIRYDGITGAVSLKLGTSGGPA